MFNKNSIAERQFTISLVVMALLFAPLTFFWVYQEQKRFTLESERFHEEFTQSKKSQLQQQVESAIDFIAYKKSQTESRVKEQIKSRVYEAHAIASGIHELYKDTKSLDEIKVLVREALRPIRFNKGRGYYFATALDGMEELFADKPQLEGKNLINMKDTRGTFVIREMIDIARQMGEGFYRYNWTKPSVEGRDFPKIAFVKYFAPLNWFIGTGEYLDDMEKEIQDEVLERIGQIRFGNDGYLFVFRFDGTYLSHMAKKYIGKNMLDIADPNGVQINRELLNAAKRPTGGFVQYVWEKPSLGEKAPKLAYAKAFPGWQWVVGTGLYLDDVERVLAERLAFSQDQVKRQMTFIVILFATCLVVTVFILRLFARSIQTGIDAFVTFFKKSATSFEEIDEKGLPYTEFRTLARYSNKMVNDRKRAEETLKQREATVQSIFSAAPVGIGLVIDRVFQKANARLCVMVGYTADELLGQNARMLYPNDEEYDRVGEEKYKQIEKWGSGTVETRWRCKNGRIIHVLLSSTPVDRNDVGAGVTFTAMDITARKASEKALRDSEKTYRDLFGAVTDALIVIDMDGKIVDANTSACHIYGYKRDEMIGMNPVQLTHPDYQFLFEQFIQQITETGHFVGQTEDVRKDGGTFTAEVRGSLVKIKGKDHCLAIIRDITDRVLAEEEKKKTDAHLQRAQKLETVGTLAGGIAHDFNNLLSVVQGNVSLMLYDLDPTHPHYENLRSIEKQVSSGASLTSQLLGYARKGRYSVKTVSLNELVTDTSETFRRTRKNITVHTNLAPGSCDIQADQGQIEQVLLNLFVNAADAMPRGGDLFLETQCIDEQDLKGKMYTPTPGPYVLLTVRDTGTGMDEDTQHRVFDPFFTTKEMGRGTGLGLASTYGIVKSHKGYIDVASILGEGTSFSIYFPAAKNAADSPGDEKKTIAEKTATVLLIDDEQDVLDVGTAVLRRLGHTVLEAQSGEQALSIYEEKKQTIDVVILDMVMPDMGGGEVYDKLKEINPQVKTLLSSGYSIEGEASEIVKRGCDGFIQKPFTMNEISRHIARVLGQ